MRLEKKRHVISTSEKSMGCLNAKFAKSPNGYLNTHVRFSEKTERSRSYPEPI